MIKNVVVFGSGQMGSGIAAIAALSGKQVTLIDQSEAALKNGMLQAGRCIAELQENGLADKTDHAVDRISYSTASTSCLENADLVIEAITEELTAKQALFETLDQHLPQEVPILSNTSGLRITDIAARVRNHPERTMTAHFWLPAHLIPLVEIVLWEQTDRTIALSVREELKKWGKQPVLVNRDLPGQLANRILQAIIREASNIVATGLASAEDVDTAIKAGMAIRFPAWGPLEHVDAVGLDLCLSVQQNVLPELDNGTENKEMRHLVENGCLGFKTKHGFYNWEEKDMEQLVRQRNEFIIAARKELSKNN